MSNKNFPYNTQPHLVQDKVVFCRPAWVSEVFEKEKNRENYVYLKLIQSNVRCLLIINCYRYAAYH
jgi:hypothetical protein